MPSYPANHRRPSQEAETRNGIEEKEIGSDMAWKRNPRNPRGGKYFFVLLLSLKFRVFQQPVWVMTAMVGAKVRIDKQPAEISMKCLFCLCSSGFNGGPMRGRVSVEIPSSLSRSLYFGFSFRGCGNFPPYTRSRDTNTISTSGVLLDCRCNGQHTAPVRRSRFVSHDAGEPAEARICLPGLSFWHFDMRIPKACGACFALRRAR